MVAVEVWQGTLAGDRGWGPAGNTCRRWSRLRSSREHWPPMIAVEVRQGTLGSDGRGWGPAGNTGRGCSRLRSGREDDEDEEDEQADIKSNNPHLTGGEIYDNICKMPKNCLSMMPQRRHGMKITYAYAPMLISFLKQAPYLCTCHSICTAWSEYVNCGASLVLFHRKSCSTSIYIPNEWKQKISHRYLTLHDSCYSKSQWQCPQRAQNLGRILPEPTDESHASRNPPKTALTAWIGRRKPTHIATTLVESSMRQTHPLPWWAQVANATLVKKYLSLGVSLYRSLTGLWLLSREKKFQKIFSNKWSFKSTINSFEESLNHFPVWNWGLAARDHPARQKAFLHFIELFDWSQGATTTCSWAESNAGKVRLQSQIFGWNYQAFFDPEITTLFGICVSWNPSNYQ